MTVVHDPIWEDFAFAKLVLAALMDGDRQVVLDLTYIPHLHSPGLANLVQVYVQLSKRGRAVQLDCVSAHNRRMLKATQLDQLFTILE
jgi:anti-anti-sigma factor